MNGQLWAALLLAFGPGAECADAKPPADPATALANGSIVTRETRSDAAGGAARMQILVDAQARAIWDVIVSCERAFVFVKGLQTCEARDAAPGRVLVHQVVKTGWVIPTYDFVFESRRRPYERIDFKLVEGNLRVMEGSWAFSEQGEATLVDYEVRIQPSAPVPGFLIRHNLSKTMPDLLACVRALANGSGSDAQERSDMKRCSGPAAPG